jgi:hypothetical protein
MICINSSIMIVLLIAHIELNYALVTIRKEPISNLKTTITF